jgi:anti-anti-sigma regulatory factor
MEELERFARLNPEAELIVDFHRVGHVSVEILSDLLWLKNGLERCGGVLRLCGLGKNMRELLRLTGMDTVFEVDEEARTGPDSTDYSTHLLLFDVDERPHETSHDKHVHGPGTGGL